MTRAMFTLAAAAAISLGLGASAAKAEERVFKWAFQGDAQSLDPQGLFETFTVGFLSNVYEGLVLYDKDLQIVPALATDWEAIDDTTWRFNLREGVKFHNGNPFTADDVIFTWQRALTKGSQMKPTASKISDIKKIGDHQIEISTPGPLPTIARELAFLLIMDKEWSEANNTTEATDVKGGDEGNYANLHANGTGPFRIVERQADVRTVFKLFDDYWGEIAGNVTTGIFTPVGENATRVAALISGELDLVYPVPVQDWPRLETSSGVKALSGAEARTIFLGMDQSRKELLGSRVKGRNPFKDKRVRLAFAHGIDIDAINTKIMRNAAEPTGLMIAPQINGYEASLDRRWAYDPEKARALLAEAGYADGFSLKMDCPNDRYVNDEKICQAVVGMLAKIGVEVDLLAQTKSKFFGKILWSNDYDTSFYLLGWTPTSIDVHNAISNLIVCRGAGTGLFNVGGYCNAEVDRLAGVIASEIDPAKRAAAIKEAMRLHYDEVGHIPLHNQPLSWGVREGLGVAQRADNVLDLRNVTVR